MNIMGFFCILATALLLGVKSSNADPFKQSKLATEFRIFTDKKGRKIKAAPLSLYTYGPWERSWLELLMTNNSKSKVRVTLLTEADQEYLKEWAASTLGTTGIRLGARTASRASRTFTIWSNSFGSYDRVRTSRGSLDLTPQNLRRATRDIEVEWYFFASPEVRSNKYTILGGGSAEFQIHPLDSINFRTDNAYAASRDTSYALLQERYVFGGRYYGWLAITRTDGNVTSLRFSQDHLKELYDPENNTWSDRVINADYSPVRVIFGGGPNAVYTSTTVEQFDEVLRLQDGEIIIFDDLLPPLIPRETEVILFKEDLLDWKIWVRGEGIFSCEVFNNLVLGKEYQYIKCTVTEVADLKQGVKLDGKQKFRVDPATKEDFTDWEVGSDALLFSTANSTYLLNLDAGKRVKVLIVR
jgi:hypothetical protein